MTAGGLKDFLNSFVEAQYRTFDVRFACDTGKGPVGTYLKKTRVITIYPNKLRGRFELLGTGLHELAHHLTWEFDGDVYASRDGEEKHIRHHGKEFLRHLKTLVRVQSPVRRPSKRNDVLQLAQDHPFSCFREVF